MTDTITVPFDFFIALAQCAGRECPAINMTYTQIMDETKRLIEEYQTKVTDDMIKKEAERLCIVGYKASGSFGYYTTPWDEQTDNGRKVWRAVAKAALNRPS